MTAEATSSWETLLAGVPRAEFIPDTIWVQDAPGTFVPVSRHDEPDRWRAVVAADAPVITQVDLGELEPGGRGSFPSSSCSQPSIVVEMLDALDARPGQGVLEIGTGTGWNAALLARCVGSAGRVTTIEIDPRVAEDARRVLANAGYDPLVITGDGMAGYPGGAPFDRVISTASIREVVPRAWTQQLRPGGRLVTPWGTDWSNGVMLTLLIAEDGAGTGRFSGDLAFMRVRDQRRALYGFEPDEATIAGAALSTTTCRGSDLDRMLNPDKGLFAIGARLPSVSTEMEWNKHGTGHHSLELDDGTTRSWARLDANLNDPAPFTVYQLGPRRLWDEAEAAYDWWYEHGKPGVERFGLTTTPDAQVIWLDDPDTVVRQWVR